MEEEINMYGYPVNKNCLVCSRPLTKKQQCFCSKICHKKYYINIKANPRPNKKQ